jgi:hypothetical protein
MSTGRVLCNHLQSGVDTKSQPTPLKTAMTNHINQGIA